MPDIRIHLDGIKDLDPADPELVKRSTIVPKPQPMNALEREILESAMRLYGRTDRPGAPFVASCLDFKDTGAKVTTVGPMAHVATGSGPGATVATGPSVSAGAGLLFGLSGGVFLANIAPAIGLYGSVDVGIVTNITAGALWQFTAFTRGPAVVFEGPPTLVIGVNISTGGPGIGPTGSGYVVVQTPKKGGPVMIGAGFGFGLGAGVLPVDIFVTSALKSTSTVSTPAPGPKIGVGRPMRMGAAPLGRLLR